MNNKAEANLFFMKLQDIGLGRVAQNFGTKKPRESGAFFNILTQIRLTVFEHAATIEGVFAKFLFDAQQLIVFCHAV